MHALRLPPRFLLEPAVLAVLAVIGVIAVVSLAGAFAERASGGSSAAPTRSASAVEHSVAATGERAGPAWAKDPLAPPSLLRGR